MHIHRNIPWKKTIALEFSLSRGANFEKKNEKGLTHIAEHLCFSGTDTISEKILSEMIREYFWTIDAITNFSSVTFRCIIERKFFYEAIDTLSAMIFHWKCSKRQWTYEKKHLVDESNEHFSSEEFQIKQKQSQALPDLIPNFITQIPPEITSKLGYEIGEKAKKYWIRLLQNSEQSLTTMGSLDEEMIQHIHKKFYSSPKKSKQSSLIEKSKKGVVIHEGVAWVFFESQPAHFFTLILHSIFEERARNMACDTCLSQTETFTMWSIGYEQKNINMILEKIFFHPINESELNAGKKRLLRLWDRFEDGIDAEDSIEWFSGFAKAKYAPLNSKNADDYRMLLEKIEPKQIFDFYEQFVESAQKNIINKEQLD